MVDGAAPLPKWMEEEEEEDAPISLRRAWMTEGTPAPDSRGLNGRLEVESPLWNRVETRIQQDFAVWEGSIWHCCYYHCWGWRSALDSLLKSRTILDLVVAASALQALSRNHPTLGPTMSAGLFCEAFFSSRYSSISPSYLHAALRASSKNEVRLLSLGRLRSRKTRIHISVPLKRRQQGYCRVQEGALASVAFRRKEGNTASVTLSGTPSASPFFSKFFSDKFSSALLVWVRRRHPARRHQGSDAYYVAIRFPPRRRSLSRPHIPCVRLEHSLEGLRKSPLTVDSHTAAGLVVPVAT
ncbi:hypothetical protein Taro_045018 [Colocasia esculenta]|uniref:Uncharacterized protein n=1 Tax=Colocasia esculenta TaxID=4460 RepID=A0A843WW07_COLES|nr:hypothetical protein [Colocasia esculenta]